MIRRVTDQLVMQPSDVKPSNDDFSVIGVFNPAAIKVGNEVVLLARVAEKPLERRSRFVGMPRWGSDGSVVVDWVREENVERCDARVVRRREDNLLRLTSVSHLRVFRFSEVRSANWNSGVHFLPESPFEVYGIEDPRITKIDGKYWITYVAVSALGAATALASTEDFVTFERHGLIFPVENKDVVLFPDKLQGKYVALHRPNPHSWFGRPLIWLARSCDLLHWGQHESLYSGTADWESDRVGAGAPPLAIDEGWLEIYHGCRRSTQNGEVGAYSAGALLLDRDDPSRILKRSRGPIMRPTTEFERTGFVPNIVFPTALIESEDLLQLYYGAADTSIGVVEFSRDELLETLQ